MYFPDLTPYQYDEHAPRPGVLNVGWLDAAHPFARGDVPPAFLRALVKRAAEPVNLCLGFHVCEFCTQATGNGEIRVTGPSGTAFAAPVMVAHYVEAHGYRPPQAFIDAVLAGDP